MNSAERHAVIVRGLQADGRVEVGELASLFSSSEITVRRDLAELEATGVLRRVHGGAVSSLKRGQELPFAMREVDAAEEKERIAGAAAALLRDGEAIVLDGGTTTLAVARRLSSLHLTVMTLSLHAVGPLSQNPALTLMVPGGTARSGELVLTGPLTEESLRGLRFDTAILSCCGVSAADGITAHEPGDAAIKRAAVAASRRTVLVADSTKFSRTALAVICPLDRLDVLVTGRDAPEGDVALARGSGVDVHVV